MFMIFDQTLFSSGPLLRQALEPWQEIIERYDESEDNSAELAKGWIKTAGSLSSLPRLPRSRPHHADRHGSPLEPYCDAKHDPDIGRTMMMAPIVDEPFTRIRALVLEAQHPRRPATQREGPDRAPRRHAIARLYSAGEPGNYILD